MCRWRGAGTRLAVHLAALTLAAVLADDISGTNEDWGLGDNTPWPTAEPPAVDGGAAAPAAGAGEHAEGGEAQGEEGGGGEGGREAEEVAMKKAERSVALTAASCLLGTTAGMQVLFYLTNCPYRMVRDTTWKMVSAVISIFAAVLIFHWLRVNLLAPENPNAIPGEWRLAHGLSHLMVSWIVSQGGMFWYKTNALKLTSVSTLGGHVTGFFAVHIFGTLQMRPFFSWRWDYAMLVAFMAGVFMGGLCWVTTRVRVCVSKLDDGEVDETEERWIDACEDFEDDVIATSLGFLLAQVTRFLIVGHMVDMEKDPPGYNITDVAMLIGTGLFFGSGLIGTTWLRHEVRARVHPRVRRMLGIGQILVGMTSAWCHLFGFRWLFVHLFTFMTVPCEVSAKMVMAMFLSLMAVLVIFLLNLAQEFGRVDYRILRSITASMGLLVGFAWEMTYTQSIEDLAESEKENLMPEATLRGALGVCPIILTVPAWQWYVLPRTDRRLKEHLQQVPDDGSEDYLDSRSGEKGSESE